MKKLKYFYLQSYNIIQTLNYFVSVHKLLLNGTFNQKLNNNII